MVTLTKALVWTLMVFGCALPALVFAQDNDDPQKNANSQVDLSERLKNASQRVADQEYLLQYRLKPGEVHRWKVEHFFSTDASIAGVNELTKCRNTSINCWKVRDVDSLGNITFQQIVEQIHMWRKVDDELPVSWDSTSEAVVPDVYATTATMVGKVQSTYTVSPSGIVVNRNSPFQETDIGIGRIIIPLPDKPIKIGYKWVVPGSAQGKYKNGTVKAVKTRQRYQLISVDDSIATISYDHQILTPIENPKIESQLMQKKCHGTIHFDIKQGRIVRRAFDWDSRVQGFEGGDSNITYRARYTETALQPQQVAKAEQPKRETVVIKHRYAMPIIRR
jgi:hypothetical protein